jgi:hypothetical protein
VRPAGGQRVKGFIPDILLKFLAYRVCSGQRVKRFIHEVIFLISFPGS